eukprot:COSAG03_NODE_283_length_9462_cov_3.269038_6_plen_82_part_00
MRSMQMKLLGTALEAMKATPERPRVDAMELERVIRPIPTWKLRWQTSKAYRIGFQAFDDFEDLLILHNLLAFGVQLLLFRT